MLTAPSTLGGCIALRPRNKSFAHNDELSCRRCRRCRPPVQYAAAACRDATTLSSTLCVSCCLRLGYVDGFVCCGAGLEMKVDQVEQPRARWSSRGIFIVACVGSAIGLGNVWRYVVLLAPACNLEVRASLSSNVFNPPGLRQPTRIMSLQVPISRLFGALLHLATALHSCSCPSDTGPVGSRALLRA